MFEISANLSEVLGAVLFLTLSAAGYRIGRLALRSSATALRRGARWIVVHLMINMAFLIIQIGLAVGLWTIDWNFASDRIVTAIPPVLVPAVITMVVTMPRLLRLASGASRAAEPPSTEHRRAAAAPSVVVPAQLAAVGAFVDFWVVAIDRPVPPYTGYVAITWSVVVVAAGLLWWRQRRRQDSITAASRQPRLGMRGVRALAGLGVIAVALLGLFAYGTVSSRLPDQMNMGAMPDMDWGGGPRSMPGGDHGMPGMGDGGTSVAGLTGPRTGTPDVRFRLVAEPKIITLSSGRTVDAWTFNGQVPGPELRAHQGDLVQVTVVNRLPETAVTVHWHGLNVPNAEDGVPGVTQDAIKPGASYVYRFRAEQAGSYWYHSHQVSSEAVVRGLFGPLVIMPEQPRPVDLDLPVPAHTWPTDRGNAEALGSRDTVRHRTVAPGTRVRLRLINTRDNLTSDLDPRVLSVSGVTARVTAIDGNDVHEPGPLTDPRLAMAIGARYDVEFTMPDHPVRLTDELAPGAGLVLSPDGTGTPAPAATSGPLFDPAHYGTPAPTPFDASSRFDRSFRLILDDGPGFFDGRFMAPPTINGRVLPNTPMLMVREGDLVKMTIIDRGHLDHPMHLHGHRVLVLSRNGKPTTGSPWWTDTLEVQPGDVYQIAFRADNPGIWMDHCHNLNHAAQGMVMHLGYAGVVTPYVVGRGTPNQPE
ncbi:MAG: multicopper oxidase family protein [Microlunatus sp.]|nr:multicopper oxidase family protein [Microlunatus sp.]